MPFGQLLPNRAFLVAVHFRLPIASFLLPWTSRRTLPATSYALAPVHTGLNPGDDHRALELGEDAHHLEHRPAARRRRVDRLLTQEQVHPGGVQVLGSAIA